ncbi:hypothetical protein GCM10008915_36330 [Bifidobacterium pullorum subsp. gallinarum]
MTTFTGTVRKYERVIAEVVERAYEAGYERGRRVGRLEGAITPPSPPQTAAIRPDPQ